MDRKLGIILSGLLFVALLATGFRLAVQKPLWNDEIYTLESTVMSYRYADILLGNVGRVEGSQAPLFYLLQKALCDVSGYSSPGFGSPPEAYANIRSQALLRAGPVLTMALSIVLIFYYFGRHYSAGLGVYSLLVSLSSYMVWFYWAEARPYSLWFFLTTCQALIFLSLIRKKGFDRRLWNGLILAHCLLSFTTVFSLFQIVSASAVLWLLVERNWKRYVLPLILPSTICLLYMMTTPEFDFYFKEGILKLINSSVSKDRFLIMIMSVIYLAAVTLRAPWPRIWKMRVPDGHEKKIMAGLLSYFGIILLGCLAVLLKLKLKDTGGDHGFSISNRYFICLAPVGIIVVTLMSHYLVRASDNKFIKGSVFVALGVLLIFRVWRTYVFIGFPPHLP